MIRRIPVFIALVAALIVSSAAPSAAAANQYMSKTTGASVDAYWTQYDNTPVGSGPFGNVHIGNLYAYEMQGGYIDAFMYIEDFDCEEGQEPWGGHGGEGEEGCLYKGSRFGYSSDMALTITGKQESARLTGSMILESGGGHGEGGVVVGNPPVDITFTGVGSLAKERYTYRYSENGTSYSSSQRSTYRTATLDGFIGGMSFDPDFSGGSISKFSSMDKQRSK